MISIVFGPVPRMLGGLRGTGVVHHAPHGLEGARPAQHIYHDVTILFHFFSIFFFFLHFIPSSLSVASFYPERHIPQGVAGNLGNISCLDYGLICILQHENVTTSPPADL